MTHSMLEPKGNVQINCSTLHTPTSHVAEIHHFPTRDNMPPLQSALSEGIVVKMMPMVLYKEENIT